MSSKSSTMKLKIPDEQWDLPATVDATGRFLSLRELVEKGGRSKLAFHSLSPELRAELTARRIAAQPTFEVAMVGSGVVDKDRAVAEVRSQSEVGRVLIEIEQRMVQSLLDSLAD